jgi:hypothetical protein
MNQMMDMGRMTLGELAEKAEANGQGEEVQMIMMQLEELGMDTNDIGGMTLDELIQIGQANGHSFTDGLVWLMEQGMGGMMPGMDLMQEVGHMSVGEVMMYLGDMGIDM